MKDVALSRWLALTAGGFVAFFATWWLIAVSGVVSRQFLPTPLDVLWRFVALTQSPFVGYTLQQHLWSSFGRFAMGFGLAAAIGVQIAQPDRPVVCVLGEGSAQYAITGFWTAAAYRAPVTFLVLRNEEYSILKWFGMLENVEGAPGLDLPALDVSAVASGYGVPSRRVSDREELTEALRSALTDALADSSGPRLVEVGVTPGMALF